MIKWRSFELWPLWNKDRMRSISPKESEFVFSFLLRNAKAENFPVNNNTMQDMKSTGIKRRKEIISTNSCTNELKIRRIIYLEIMNYMRLRITRNITNYTNINDIKYK